jgi:predicted phage terminase large subunit-like protein
MTETPNLRFKGTKDEARQKCLDDIVFLAEVLGYDLCEDPHREMFNALQSDDLSALILWPRGHFKTSAVAVYAVWRILKNPEIRISALQATLKLTKGWVAEMASHFNGKNPKSRLPALFPEFCGKDLGDATKFTVPARTRQHLKEATVTAASPRATATGQHYDLILADDLVNSSNFRNVDLLDKLESEFYHLLPLLDPGGQVRVTGTRYSHADLYARIIATDKGVGKWTISVKECYKPDGSLLFPERLTRDGRTIGFTAELLAELQRKDPEMFVSQFLNKIMLGKDQLFPSTLIQASTKATSDPEYPATAPCIFVVDLATGKRADADHSVIGVARVDNRGRVWVVDLVGGIMSPHTLAMNIVQMTVKYRPLRVLVEKQPGAEFFVDFLRTVARERNIVVPVDYTSGGKAKNAKYLRVASLESGFRQKRLFLLAGITDFERMAEELEQFPRGRHDDRPDVIALLCNALSAQVPYTPAVKRLPWVFSVPHTEPAKTQSSSPLGDGFCA